MSSAAAAVARLDRAAVVCDGRARMPGDLLEQADRAVAVTRRHGATQSSLRRLRKLVCVGFAHGANARAASAISVARKFTATSRR